jgi:hypothetical protein
LYLTLSDSRTARYKDQGKKKEECLFHRSNSIGFAAAKIRHFADKYKYLDEKIKPPEKNPDGL